VSGYAVMCEAIAADLAAQVSGLSAATQHLYVPWSPEELAAMSGERHLAVWPVTEAETAEPFVTNGQLLRQTYAVLVWENAGDDPGRLRTDVPANKGFLDLAEAVRDRFFLKANIRIGGADDVRYTGTSFPEQVSLVRWFFVGLSARIGKDYT
jgi:hypothetical protein